MFHIGTLKDLPPTFNNVPRKTIMDYLRSQHSNNAMTVVDVIPLEEAPAKRHGIFLEPESIRKIRMILQRLELAFKIRAAISISRRFLSDPGESPKISESFLKRNDRLSFIYLLLQFPVFSL
ncbi:MAG: hypothetical protein JRJ66_08140 [Deltaproteobacteria bacterium]|nr:hypothetical protein [Deltaproteobacteria bacterium]MBW1934425.1 hypothetical protein [Deltaproteobacteria bacterium]MBW2046249.1 hypothetical protein [Deltaproteobacteria bacterium]